MPSKMHPKILLRHIKQFHARFNRPPRVGDFRNRNGYPDPTTYFSHFGSWNEALRQAGVPHNRRPWTAEQIVNWAKSFYKRHRRLPQARDLRPNAGAPTYDSIALRFKVMEQLYISANLPVPRLPAKTEFIARVKKFLAVKNRRPRCSEVLDCKPFTAHSMRMSGFSSYHELLRAAGVGPFRTRNLKKRDVIDGLRILAAKKSRPLTTLDVDREPDFPSVSFIQSKFGTFRNALRLAKLPIGPGRHGRLWHMWEKHCVAVAQAVYGHNAVIAGRKTDFGIPDIQVPGKKLIIEVMASAYIASPKERELRNYLRSRWDVECWCIRGGAELRTKRLRYRYSPEISADLKKRGFGRLASKTMSFYSRSDSLRKQAGLYKRSDLKEMLVRLMVKLGRTPSRQDVLNEPGYPHPETFARCLGKGSFHTALKTADLQLPSAFRRRTKDELIALLRKLSRKLGRTPTSMDIQAADNYPALNTFTNRFGGLNPALISAGLKPNRLMRQAV